MSRLEDQRQQEREYLLLLIALSGTNGRTVEELWNMTHWSTQKTRATVRYLLHVERALMAHEQRNHEWVWVLAPLEYVPPPFDGRQLALPFGEDS